MVWIFNYVYMCMYDFGGNEIDFDSFFFMMVLFFRSVPPLVIIVS